MTTRDDEHPSFQDIGQRPAFRYMDDAINVGRSMFQDQLLRISGVWQRIMLGQETPERWMSDVAELWQGWIQAMGGAAAFPMEWNARRGMSVPNVVFMIDDVAEAAASQSALTNINAEGLVVAATDLRRVGGDGAIRSANVEVGLRDRGSRVEVSLVHLGHERRVPGLYLGLAYAYERPNMRPLATIWVHVQGPLQPAATLSAP